MSGILWKGKENKIVRMKLYIVAFLLLLLSGCSGKNETAFFPVIDIEAAAGNCKEVMLSRYCSKIEYLPLGSENEFPVGERFFLFPQADGFYIGESSNSKCAYFGTDGKLKNTIGSRGRAKGEYISILHAGADRYGNIVISDFDKLTLYDKNGELKGILDLGLVRSKTEENIQLYDFLPIGDYYAFYGMNPATSNAQTVFVDTLGYVVMVYNPYPDEKGTAYVPMSGKRNTASAYLYKDSLVVADSYSDTLFRFDPQLNRIPAFAVHYGKYKMKSGAERDGSITVNARNSMETESFVLLSLISWADLPFMAPDNRVTSLVYDKATGQATILPYSEVMEQYCFTNDIDGGAPFAPDAVYGDKIYQVIDAIHFIELSKEYGSPEMKEIAKGLDENSNPVLVVATLK